MFERVESLIGSDNLEKIFRKTVLIVGLGGVGGYALEALVRSGIKNFILVDHDKIDISNLNRQIVATSLNVGKFKVDEFKKRIISINPDCNIYTFDLFLDESNINIIDKFDIDYIIDCCDTVKTKIKLIEYSIKHDINIISSMGTAKKMNPSKLVITDIRKTSYDPLARVIRKYINDNNIKKIIPVVSSTEEVNECDKLASMIFVPATAGLLIANYVIKDIIK